ncbi:hypothetical protein [Streptomyces tricolor]|uniref:hypothetical protein n=1 Tax=Streptomyces tricolor TaxID=68277 RepID=UPI0036E7130A
MPPPARDPPRADGPAVGLPRYLGQEMTPELPREAAMVITAALALQSGGGE